MRRVAEAIVPTEFGMTPSHLYLRCRNTTVPRDTPDVESSEFIAGLVHFRELYVRFFGSEGKNHPNDGPRGGAFIEHDHLEWA